MDHFNGFTHMNQYFIDINSNKEDKESLDLERKKLDEYKELIDDTKRKMLKKIKHKGAELLCKITDTKKDVELENTKKIKCNGHEHKSLKTYNECTKKIYEDIDTSAEFAYFFDINDPTFDLMIESLFDMFPETSEQTYLDKILKIKELALEKEKMYKLLINGTNTETDNEESDNLDKKESDEADEVESDEAESDEVESDEVESDTDSNEDSDIDETSDSSDTKSVSIGSEEEKTPEEEKEILKDIIGSLHFSLKKATKFAVVSKIKKEIAEKESELQKLIKEYKLSK